MQYISFMDNSKKTLKIKRTSLSQEVYQHLQQQIITLELAPGEKLNDLELAEQFGVSRTPVREAMKKLEEEGLVVFKPGSRTNVTALNVVQARETFPIVATLHGLASQLAFPHITPETLVTLRKLNTEFRTAIGQEDALEAMQCDDAFHHVFLQASQNQQLTETLSRLTPLVRRLEFAQFSRIGSSSADDHDAIIQACEQRDVDLLVRLTRQNWNGLGRHIIAALKEE